MTIRKLSLHRRALLRGAGVAIALPILDTMTPALAGAADTPAPVKRIGVAYVPNGMSMDYWKPKTTGAFELTPIMQPLAPFHDRLLVLSGMNPRRAAAAATRAPPPPS